MNSLCDIFLLAIHPNPATPYDQNEMIFFMFVILFLPAIAYYSFSFCKEIFCD